MLAQVPVGRGVDAGSDGVSVDAAVDAAVGLEDAGGALPATLGAGLVDTPVPQPAATDIATMISAVSNRREAPTPGWAASPIGATYAIPARAPSRSVSRTFSA